jgi:hypothetical protein
VNRNDEYLTLMSEIENTPKQLEYAEKHAEERLKSEHRRKIFIAPLSSLALLLIVFTMLVNCFPTFAYACSRIPLIKELVQVVAFSPSLSAVVENEYVQPIELEQTINGITARIEYVIVDQKQLNIFYSLDSDVYTEMNFFPQIKLANGTEPDGCCISTGNPTTPNGKLNYIRVDYVDRDMPGSLLLIAKVYNISNYRGNAPVRVEDSMPSDEKPKELDIISEFTFLLEFDPYYTAQGENIKLNNSFNISGQTIILEDVEIYPTHIRFNFSDKDNNTAWLKSLSFYLENEKGKRFDKITNGITATGSPNSPMMRSHRLESSFFSNSKELTLHIIGVEWLDKDMRRVKLDLANGTAERLPQGVTFENAERRENGWMLTFAAIEYEKNTFYGLWGNNYYDEQGKEYSFNSWSSGMGGYWDEEAQKHIDIPGVFRVEIPLKNYPYDVVYMSPAFSRKIELSQPVVIRIK